MQGKNESVTKNKAPRRKNLKEKEIKEKKKQFQIRKKRIFEFR